MRVDSRKQVLEWSVIWMWRTCGNDFLSNTPDHLRRYNVLLCCLDYWIVELCSVYILPNRWSPHILGDFYSHCQRWWNVQYDPPNSGTPSASESSRSDFSHSKDFRCRLRCCRTNSHLNPSALPLRVLFDPIGNRTGCIILPPTSWTLPSDCCQDWR